MKKKFAQYSEYMTLSDDPLLSLKKALDLTHNEKNFYTLLKFCLTLSPQNSDFIQIKKDNSLLLSLINDVDHLKDQLELLRNKFNSMHEALCYSEAFKVKEVDDYAAKLSPVEFFDKGASETLIVFGGMATKPSMPPKEFFASFYKKAFNIIFVKDFQQCWYQNGLIGLSSDIDSTINYLKSLIPLSTKNLTCIGTSAGGYASIRIGVALNAKRILAFAPQTKIDNAIFNKFKSLDSRINEVNIKNNPDLNLEMFLEKTNYTGQIDLFYGDKNINDTKAAMNVADYVDLHSYPTDTHMIASFLKKKDLLNNILNSI